MYRPWMNRYIGVEMEMERRNTRNRSLSSYRVHGALAGAGLSQAVTGEGGAWGHSNGNTWDVKSDSSAGPPGSGGGWEVATPKLLLDATGHNRDLKRGCNAIAELTPVVSIHCGLHVHVDLSDFTWRDMQALVALWGRYEPLLFELVPASRRNNSFCRALRGDSWGGPRSPRWDRVSRIATTEEDAFLPLNNLTNDKYSALNLCHWWRSRRVEVRMFAGTVDYDKIRMWSMLLLAIVARAKLAGAPRPQPIVAGQKPCGFSTRYFARQLGLIPGSVAAECPPEAAQLVAWIEARRAKFAPGA